MHGKPLSALLQILRSAGVTRYQTPELTLELGPAPARRGAPSSIDLSPEALEASRQSGEDGDDDMGDPRFALERIGPRWFPGVKADPTKNKGTQ